AQQIERTIGPNATLHTVDLARKIREDPLFVIKKREANAAKDVMENSARIRQIIDSSKRDSRRNSGVSKLQDTPSHSKLSKVGWETPSRKSSKRTDSKHYHDSKRRKLSSPSSSDDANDEKLQKMLNNGRWRESSRKNKIDVDMKEEELDKNIEEHIRKLKG
ncbi:hypothetical protein MXB_3888, partial [Myxobolus squamalis]